MFFSFFYFPKSAQVGLRLPDTHLQQQGFFLFHLHVSGGGRRGRGQEEREKIGKIHLSKSHKETYVPSIMEVCSPTTGSTLVNILLVFLRHLF